MQKKKKKNPQYDKIYDKIGQFCVRDGYREGAGLVWSRTCREGQGMGRDREGDQKTGN